MYCNGIQAKRKNSVFTSIEAFEEKQTDKQANYSNLNNKIEFVIEKLTINLFREENAQKNMNPDVNFMTSNDAVYCEMQ